MLIENQGGAGGTVGAANAAKRAPDGYNWFFGAVHHTIAESLYARLNYGLELVKSEIAKWATVVKDAGAKVDN